MAVSRTDRVRGVRSALAPENTPYQLFLLVQQMTKRFHEVLRPHGITPLHWGVLCCLWREDGLPTTEVAQRLEQLGGTVTVGLNAMVREGLVERRVQPKDRRVTRIYLTPKGRAMRRALEPAAQRLIRRIFSPLEEGERESFEATVATLREHLGPR